MAPSGRTGCEEAFLGARFLHCIFLENIGWKGKIKNRVSIFFKEEYVEDICSYRSFSNSHTM